MNTLTVFGFALAFLVTLFLTPLYIKYLRRIDLLVKDMNKKNNPLVPLSAGFAVLSGIFIGLMYYVFVQTFIYSADPKSLIAVFAVTTSLFIITSVGFIDDIIIRKDKNNSQGLKQWQKPLLTLSAAIPLMVVNAGVAKVWIPFLGGTKLGLIYPLLLVPLGVVVAANMVNMLAGFNGMEAGMGLVHMGMLGLFALVNGRGLAAIIAFTAFAALLAFFFFNKSPAKILPGDSLTYLLGGLIASVAIVGNIEKAALIISIPFIIEFFLKARSKFKAQSYGYPYGDGKVKTDYKKIYSLTHVFTRSGRFSEKQITFSMILIQLFFASLIWVV